MRKTGRFFKFIALAIVFAALVVVATVIPVVVSSIGGGVSYSALHYDTVVQTNGDITITQTLTAVLPKRGEDSAYHQLYQQYALDPAQYDDITDISVTDSTGKQYAPSEEYANPAYHTDEGWDDFSAYQWYKRDAGYSEDGKPLVEIGWNIPSTQGSDGMTFTVSMTFTNVTTKHPDVAEFQWEPIGDTNETPISNLTGTLHFPEGINKDNSWAWLHFAGDSTTSRDADGTLEYSIPYVPPKTHVDVRTMFDPSVITTDKTSDTPAKQSIMDDETTQEKAWADQLHRQAVIRLTIWIVSAAVIVLLAAWTLFTALSTHRKSQYRGNLEYFRDLPPLSPAATTKLLDIIDRGTIPKPGNSTPEALSSTILSLASKKAIALLPGSSDLYDTELSDGKFTLNNLFSASSANTQEPRNAEDFTVVLLAEYQNPTAGANPALSSSEQAALEFLKFLGEQVGQLYFDFDQANDALKNSLDDASTTSLAHHANRLLQQVQVAGLKELTATKAYQPKSGRNASWALLLVASLAAAFLYSWTGQVFIALVLGIFGGVIAAFGRRWGSNYILTNKGQELAGQIIGLRNYLLDFSNFKDRGVPDLTLWDRYLVYATAFGISEKVAKQLALSAPQIQDPQWLYSNYTIYPLLFVSYHRWAWDLPNGSGGSSTSFGPFNSNFGANSGIGNLGNQLQSNIHSIQSTVTHALNVPSDSSGSGSSGGSFSGGGFGGSGGGFGGGSFGAR